jgi:hypothetical protein
LPENTCVSDARQSRGPRLYRGLQSYAIPVWNGIFEHRKKIDGALWEFLWCLDRVTEECDGIGKVFGGAPVKLERIAAELDGDKESTRRHLGKLKSGNYIRTLRTPYGLIIEVLNSRKFGVLQKPQSAVSRSGEKPTYESEKLQSAVSKEDVPSIDRRGGGEAPLLAFDGEHLKITIEQDQKLRSWFEGLDVAAQYLAMDRYVETHHEKNYNNFYAFARKWLDNERTKGNRNGQSYRNGDESKHERAEGGGKSRAQQRSDRNAAAIAASSGLLRPVDSNPCRSLPGRTDSHGGPGIQDWAEGIKSA